MIKEQITSPVGLDREIDRMMSGFNSDIINTWSIDDDQYNAYLLAEIKTYNKEKSGLFIFDNGTDKDYIDVMLNDNITATSVFYQTAAADMINADLATAAVRMLWFVDLSRITAYQNNNYRFKGLIHRDVVDTIEKQNNRRINVTAISQGDQAVEGIDLNDRELRDFHPYHTFAVDMDIVFQISKTC
jgi:hypothetical protein